MFTPDKPFTFDRVVRLILGAGSIIALIWLLGYLSTALVPFTIALLLAYLLNPITTWLEKRLRSRGLSVCITFVGLLLLTIGVFWIVIPTMASEFSNMGRVLKDLASNQEFAARVRAHLPDDLWAWLKGVADNKDIQLIFTNDGATSAVQSILEKIMPGIRGVLHGTANFLSGFLSLGVILLYLVFLLADFGRIKDNWQEYLPPSYRETITEFIDEFEMTMSRYFRGQVVIAILVGVLLSIGFLLIGLPLAVVLGMFTGILNIAPYLGTIGILPATLLAGLGSIEAGESPWMGIGLVLAVFAIVQAIQEIILIPRIQGKGLGLSPWLILLALAIWSKLLGFLGLLIALPMTCLFLSYYRRFLAAR